MQGIEDKDLISRYLQGDEKSLEILIKRHLKSVYNFVYRRVGNFQDAEDLTQEIFVKAWRNLKKFDRQRSFSAWIFSIARNTCIDFLRKKETTIYLEANKEPGQKDKNLELINLSQILSWTKTKLAPEYQKVLVSYFEEQLNFREIAAKTGESINTVKSRYRRAILKLRRLL